MKIIGNNLVDAEISNTSNQGDEKIAPNCFVDKIMHLFLRHNLTLVCLEDVMKLLNEGKEEWNKFPTSKRLILKLFRQHRDVFETFYMVKCCKCKHTNKIDSESKRSQCEECDNPLEKSETAFFVYIPIRQQIIKSIKENRVFVNNCTGDGSYCDAHDGSILKNVMKQYQDTDVNVLSLCLNLDGANKFKSNVLSVWPIQLIQNYLIPEIRFLPNHIIVAGLHYNKKKPNCFDFMLPLVKEINDQRNSEILVIQIEGVDYKFKPIITHCAVDLPAKSLLQETKQFGSYDGCTFCHIPGEAVTMDILNDSDDEEIKKKKKKSKKKREGPKKYVRYVEGDEMYALRDANEMLETMLAVSQSETGEAVDGIKGN